MKPATSGDLVVALFGARGSGKSYTVKQYLKGRRPARVLIWDTMDEYGEHAERVGTLTALLERAKGERFALRYVPRGTDAELAQRFEAFCAIAYALGRLVVVVEELQRVTKPAWAPAAWSDCTLRGRHQRLSIFGVSQRPASVDKNFFSNATHIRGGRLNFDDDIACMANALRVPRERVAALRDQQYIARNMLTGELEATDEWSGGSRGEPVNAAPARAPRARKPAIKRKKVAPKKRR